ncbi:unnamed protein product [Closterium sp. Naga37s-1]|nr:unnamed protein product [Closterium sp. Naga37s-1]
MQVDQPFLHIASECIATTAASQMGNGGITHLVQINHFCFLPSLALHGPNPPMQIDRFFLHFAGEESYHSRLSEGEQRYCDKYAGEESYHSRLSDGEQRYHARYAGEESYHSRLSDGEQRYHARYAGEESYHSRLSDGEQRYCDSCETPQSYHSRLLEGEQRYCDRYASQSYHSQLSGGDQRNSGTAIGRSGADASAQDCVPQSALSTIFFLFCSRQVDLVQAHLDRTALTRLPRRYQSILKQADSSETPDMIPTPDLDTFVFCVATRPLPSVQLDPE